MRIRREPPSFRRAAVTDVGRTGPRLARIVLSGPELIGFAVTEPAASVRLLLPSAGSELVLPSWNGNEFLLAAGQRPTIRTLTPRDSDATAGTLVVEILLHGDGAASQWAAECEPGAAVAISGPGRGYTIAAGAPAFLLAGDETAIPAMSQLLEVLPPTTPVQAIVEIAAPDGRVGLPSHPAATVAWHDLAPNDPPGTALAAAVREATPGPGTRIWVAGEAAAVQRIRRFLFEERAFPRGHATVRGYWKRGRRGSDDLSTD
jgi:NADPH-dependent ferric siderophore reductase